MNTVDWILTVLLIAITVSAITVMVKTRKKNCDGYCSGCAYRNDCKNVTGQGSERQ